MKITEIPAKPKEQKTVRVAAYARVSSDKDAAFHSLEAQTEYYEEYISSHPSWELVDIYSDNGISGTTVNRPEFQRMLEDCRAGKIDLVVTKSVTRFARNTVTLLETIRELKALGIDCYFEKEQMHSISPDGELLLTLLAMHAEEEARSASENQLWRIRKKFEKGEPTYCRPYGYVMVDGKLQIVQEEAAVVRQIFGDYLSGMGRGKIAKRLNEQGVPAPYGQTWSVVTITRVLRNEKYSGDMLLQKTYVPDFRKKTSKVNRGNIRQYYVESSHEAIVPKEIFQAARQEELRRRSQFAPAQNSVHTRNELFKGLIRCGICGSLYHRKYTNAHKYDRAIWICKKHFDLGKQVCSSQKIPESILIEKTKEVLKTDTLTREILEDKLRVIIVPEHNHLTYIFKDDTSVEVFWAHPSRSLSWTPEMRQAAREKTLKRYGKEK